MHRWLKFLIGLALGLFLAVLYIMNPRLPSPDGEQSALLYQPGDFGIQREAITLVDSSRPTRANDDFPGSDVRELDGFVWYPDADPQSHGPFPLIVYSHGFMSSVAEPEYLVDFLVPKGYVVVAVNYPLSHGGAPGGPTVVDVINQPGDVSFVIDSLLTRNADGQDSLFGFLDPARIAAVGLSLGGLTTQLAAFHRDERDPRIAVAVSIAGPSAPLEPRFFETTDIPFMMIAGSGDAIVPYDVNAAPIPAKAPGSLLVTLDGGTHVGFAGIATTVFRWSRHPDRWVCPMLLSGLDREDNEGELLLAPDPDIGISTNTATPCTMETWERAMRPAPQQMLTRLALFAFLEQHFHADAEVRQQLADYLAQGLSAENPSAAVHQQ